MINITITTLLLLLFYSLTSASATVSTSPSTIPPKPKSKYVNGIPQSPIVLVSSWDGDYDFEIDRPYLEKNINAFDCALWVNLPTTSSCPMFKQEECPPGNLTALKVSRSGKLNMSVVYPGGQQMYIHPLTHAGMITRVRYGMPEGAIKDGFKIEFNKYKRPLLANDLGSWIGCAADNARGPWKVFFELKGQTLDPQHLPGKDRKKCYDLQLALLPVSERAYAYAYV
ncbi:hypothetical protein H072_8410 [Dactylellina haptotyla CBS 200.50]|uniref:Uncharacterized protein n=1 Tax=Dactylellina haptotyla (strain CBS 200.50) TaxID=1284197 RepID=S8A454_DACHA|nr:hypothetical protein H072_8410 [Dactylellina haptotyla CBS 200.50]